MCLAVPAQIIDVRNDGMGVVDHAGNRREISLMLLENPAIGDYVIIHAGFAIHTIDEESARESMELLDMLARELPPT
jgi:hydrogenase expression/formation protein HypC